MSEIKNLKPEEIWRNFDALTQIPRPSGHMEKVQQFLLDFAKNIGIEAYKDAGNNIYMYKPATPGMENKKGIILQLTWIWFLRRLQQANITLKQILFKLILMAIGLKQKIQL
jgi:hypothetical protein